MVIIRKIDFSRLKSDLLDIVGPSGIWPLISAVDTASESELIEYAEEFGLDIRKYVLEDEMENENDEEYEDENDFWL
ncbi:hypothetical protein PL321_07780 [Caloramator sp. mosi_1]|uniref:hypothetical protein n=1 Tax=Caloramator sp. mosi_1 TaxID=3023090 RepID=UPI00235FDFD0|nr:hypothetical protein [Caloramator sp. mosi_1]WDC85326.1 hypothetical protein PL321_07780 [Caloramator sp. mosi_1]